MKTDIEIAQEAVMQPIKEVQYLMVLERMIWSFMENIKQSLQMISGKK